MQKLINVLARIRKYWWENFSKINKRTGTTIPNSRLHSLIVQVLKTGKTSSLKNPPFSTVVSHLWFSSRFLFSTLQLQLILPFLMSVKLWLFNRILLVDFFDLNLKESMGQFVHLTACIYLMTIGWLVFFQKHQYNINQCINCGIK